MIQRLTTVNSSHNSNVSRPTLDWFSLFTQMFLQCISTL